VTPRKDNTDFGRASGRGVTQGMKLVFLLYAFLVALGGLEGITEARTSQRDLIALALIKEEVKDRDEHWKRVMGTWQGGGPCDSAGNCEDDPCGFDWKGNWEGVQCRYQEHLPKDVDRVVTNIHITDTKVTGPVPLGYSLLHDLVELDMDGNHVSGPLIPQVACLPKLVELDLANNSLWGTIPTAWRGLTELEECEMEVNTDLEGCIPQGMPPVTTQCPPELSYCELVGTITDDTKVWGFCEDYPDVNLWCPTAEEVRQFIDNGMPYDSLIDPKSMSTSSGDGMGGPVVSTSGFEPPHSSLVRLDVANDDDEGEPVGILGTLFRNIGQLI